MGQRPRPLAKFLKKQRIVPQYAILGRTDQNGIDERKNRNT